MSVNSVGSHSSMKLLRRLIDLGLHLGEAPLHFLGRQRSRPAGVGGGQHQGRGQPGIPAVHLQRHHGTPRQPQKVWLRGDGRAQEASGDGPEFLGGQARGRVVRLAAPGSVPGEHRELVRETLQLGAPDPAVTSGAVEQDQRRSLSDPLVRDPQPIDLDGFHDPMLGRSARLPGRVRTRPSRPRRAKDPSTPEFGVEGSLARRQRGCGSLATPGRCRGSGGRSG